MISIIIPTYNEEEVLSGNQLHFQKLCRETELIFVDGGSLDQSREIARNFGRVLTTEKGRARQMNYGARFAGSEILLFLHADNIISPDTLSSINQRLTQGNFIGGCLTQRIDHKAFVYRLIEWQGNVRARMTKEFYGDQGIFVKKHVFLATGGFPEFPIMEDVLFSRKMRAKGKTVILSDRIIVSPRRWRKKGIIKTAFLYSLINILFHLRFPLIEIKKLYEDLR